MSLSQVIDDAIQKASENTNVNNNDYEKDGLLYCGNCNTPKQTRVIFLGIEKTPYCLCKCEAAKRNAEDEMRKQQEQTSLINRLRYEAFPDCKQSTGRDDMKNWTFENTNGSHPKIMAAAKKYVDNFADFKSKGKGLMFYGPVGTGKSYLAAAIANALIDKGIPVLMTNFVRIANEMQGTFEKQQYIDSFNKYSLLIIDDLAAERKTDFMQEIVWNVINSRSLSNLPMIVTSNLTSAELKNPTDINNQRNFSRLIKCCHPIKVDGEDQRKRKAVEDFAAMNELLGI